MIKEIGRYFDKFLDFFVNKTFGSVPKKKYMQYKYKFYFHSTRVAQKYYIKERNMYFINFRNEST
jgi:hypothetical protein